MVVGNFRCPPSSSASTVDHGARRLYSVALLAIGAAVAMTTSVRAEDCETLPNLGFYCGFFSSAGPETTSVGTLAGINSVFSTPERNANFGMSAGAYNQGDNNVAIGWHAGGSRLRDANDLAIPIEIHNTVAVGANSQALSNGGIAIGANVTATRENQVAIGTAAHTYTLAGINSAASKAAQGGPAYMVTSDAEGNLATSTFDLATLENLPSRMDAAEQNISNLQTTVSGHGTRITNVETKNTAQDARLTGVEAKNLQQDDRLAGVETKNVEQDGRLTGVENKNLQQDDRLDAHQSTLSGHTSQITALDSRVGVLENRMDEGFARLDGRIDQAFEGAAMAMAMAAPAMPYDKNYAVSINWGNFEGKNAFAGTAQARVSESFVVHGGIGFGSSGTVGGRAGLSFAW